MKKKRRKDTRKIRSREIGKIRKKEKISKTKQEINDVKEDKVE
jgi:hypothetical protein